MSLPRLFRSWFIILSLSSLVGILFFALPHEAYAQTSLGTDSLLEQNVSNSTYVHVQSTLISLTGALVCQLTGMDVIDPTHGCLGVNPVTGKLGYASDPKIAQVGGLLGVSTGMIGSLYERPVTSGAYIQYLSRQFGIGQKTYAVNATQGFDVLYSLQDIWLKMRNIAYFFLIIIFIAIGFMIMIRVKIDPRTVMSVQNQIPKVIIGIILITFSYAIVGLLIDLMWVTTYFGINFLTDTPGQPSTSVRKEVTENLENNPLYYMNTILNAGPDSEGGLTNLSGKVSLTLGDVLSRALGSMMKIDQDSNCSRWNPTTWGGCVMDTFKGIIKYFIAIIVFLIVGFALLFALLRVWFSLLRALVYVILYTILGPLFMIMGLFPGSSYGFTRWLRTLLAHLAIFPVTVMIFLLAKIFAENTALNNPTFVAVPPLIANPNTLDNFGYLIAFGLILLTPELQTFVREALKAKPGPVGGLIKTGFAAGVAPGTALPKSVWGRAWKPWDPHTGKDPGFLRKTLVGGGITPTTRRQVIFRRILGGEKMKSLK